jgi:hypothetical protein
VDEADPDRLAGVAEPLVQAERVPVVEAYMGRHPEDLAGAE